MQGIAGLPAQPEIEYPGQISRRVPDGLREKVSREIANSSQAMIEKPMVAQVKADWERRGFDIGYKVRS
jgi:hypothetical protein